MLTSVADVHALLVNYLTTRPLGISLPLKDFIFAEAKSRLKLFGGFVGKQ